MMVLIEGAKQGQRGIFIKIVIIVVIRRMEKIFFSQFQMQSSSMNSKLSWENAITTIAYVCVLLFN